ncbi:MULTISPECIES: hypothetical protein [Klebsiella/Raoultella group]|uniref:hypothetical protein n=1 Tax=Klebsiella/Raoultella group TaxID=2890311 RepID=UPI00164C3636|nr:MULTISPECIES: hypothetical protein [Klebsiella/Raoultella group]MBC4754934.1 hypothetical protein [Klebsiella variicola]MDV1448281.1 hypothetical protein [Raoultella planticola]MDV1563995.1 hypothetical protein [Raoultella planticola]MDV1570573.1 hypothetical protein [Raoultella planticola]MDV1630854.1 hypothetical protein [Raoultella planticola]
MGFWGERKRAAERAAVTGEVLVAIETAALYTRNDSELPRVIVQPSGWTGFLYSEENASRWLDKAFPGALTPQQKTRALNYLESLVRQRHKDSQPKTKTSNWVNRWKYDD